jgi:hypothetical protein
MPFTDAPRFNPKEDDALACVDAMGPELQRVIDQRHSGNALICALSISYAELIRSRGGREELLLQAMECFATLPKNARDETRNCHAQVKEVIGRIQQQGFSADAIMWAMIGAITKVFSAFGFPKAEIDKCLDGMITHLNHARKSAIN